MKLNKVKSIEHPGYKTQKNTKFTVNYEKTYRET